jgi:hypothetical protein
MHRILTTQSQVLVTATYAYGTYAYGSRTHTMPAAFAMHTALASFPRAPTNHTASSAVHVVLFDHATFKCGHPH